MPDVAFGYLLLAIAMVVVLAIVFLIASRGGPAVAARPSPPRGVHLPNPSFLPVVMSLAAALLGAGLAFKDPEQIANPFIAIPGLVLLVLGVIAWVRAANREWRDVDHGTHDDGAAH